MIFCFDLDGTICYTKKSHETYEDVLPIEGMPDLLRDLASRNHTIIINTARHMLSCNNNVGKVIARQGFTLFKWLEKHNIPYDEVHFGKPYADFYIDDKAIKFLNANDLKALLNQNIV